MFSRSQMSRTGFRGLLVAAAIVMPLVATPAHARTGDAGDKTLITEFPNGQCTVAALKGAYDFSARGYTHPASPVPPALQGPLASVGTTEFDGAGNVTITPFGSIFNGTTFPVPAEQGTYTVDSNCMVEAQFPSGITARGVLVDQNRRIYVIQTTTGTTVSGTALLSDRDKGKDKGGKPFKCTAKGLAGRYGFLVEGYVGPPTFPTAPNTPVVGNGVVTYNESGTFMATQAVRSIGGAVDPMPMTYPGTFTVNASCAVQMTFAAGFTFVGTVTRGGDEILFVETDPGTTALVKVTRQD